MTEALTGIGTQGVVVLLGADAAMLAAAKHEAGPSHRIVCVEPAEPIDRADGRVYCAASHDFTWLDRFHRDILNGSLSVFVPRAAPERFMGWLDEMKAREGFMRAGVGTMVGMGKAFMDAYLANIPTLAVNPGVYPLAGAFCGAPAVVISAGPSLDTASADLRRLKGCALLVAVDAAVPFLVAEGIIPDIIVGIDPLAEQEGLYRGFARELSAAALVCSAQYAPGVVAAYPGPVFMADMPGTPLARWLSPFWQPKGALPSGGSVSHAAIGLAEYMGCDPICLAGQDLSFKSDQYYARGIDEALHGRRTADPRQGAQRVRNSDGDEVYTTPTLLLFRAALEMRLRATHATVLNATPGGLAITGAQPCRLDLFARSAQERQFREELHRLHSRAPVSTYDRAGLVAELRHTARVLRQLARRMEYAGRQMRRLSRMHMSPYRTEKQFTRLLTRSSDLVTSTHHPALALVAHYDYALELYLSRTQVAADDADERLEQTIRQNERILSAQRETIGRFAPHLEDLAARLSVHGGGV